MVTLYDVARRAAVSIATVSRVVHGQDRVREATRIRVQQAIEELGYVPDGAGQSLSRRRKDILGMMCVERETAGQHDIETECLLYYDEVQRGVQARIRDSQWLLLSSFVQADGFGERACARLLDRIAYPSLSPAVELLPTELVLRSSCGCPPGTEIRQLVKTLKPG
jgi:DNA-binding LacI/PurR family transcriptional regulator